jgi:hypothetical protein
MANCICPGDPNWLENFPKLVADPMFSDTPLITAVLVRLKASPRSYSLCCTSWKVNRLNSFVIPRLIA